MAVCPGVVFGLVVRWYGVYCGAEICTCQQKGADICMIGDRLRQERERLGLTQPAFADAAGGKKRTLIDWEKGVSSPTAVQLAALAGIGVDVLYILTGQRTGGASAPAPARAVSEGDRVLLDNFHAAPAQVQAGVKTTLGAFADASAPVKGRRRAA